MISFGIWMAAKEHKVHKNSAEPENIIFLRSLRSFAAINKGVFA